MTSSASTKSSQRAVYLDILRTISSVLIIFTHISALNWNDVPAKSHQWQTMNFYDCIAILGVPLFFMISGSIFLNSEYKISYQKLYFHKILRLFLIYHMWLLFYNSLPFIRGELSLDFVTVKDELFLKTFMGQGIYHLWFIPELIVLYIISPILKDAFDKKHICRYFLIIYAVTGAFLPTTFIYNYPYRAIVESYYTRTSLVMLTGYIGYFVLGHYLHSHVTKSLNKTTICALSCVAVIFMAFVIITCNVDAMKKNSPSTLLNTPFMLPQFISCSCIFLIVKNCCHNIPKHISTIFTHLSKYTMGIYLLHPLVIYILRDFGVSTLMLHPIIMIPLLSLLVFVICLILTRLLLFIPIVNKWLL